MIYPDSRGEDEGRWRVTFIYNPSVRYILPTSTTHLTTASLVLAAMRSFAIALVASAASALGATMQINDSNFQDHMALTVLEGLFGMEGQ